MNGFRLVLCLAGLLTYVVTKHFTTPDEQTAFLPSSGGGLLGVGLNIDEPEVSNPVMLAWMGSTSNAQPALLSGPARRMHAKE